MGLQNCVSRAEVKFQFLQLINLPDINTGCHNAQRQE